MILGQVRFAGNVAAALSDVAAEESSDKSGLWSTAKILVSNYQVLHHPPDALANGFPPAVQAYVSQLAPFNFELFTAFDFQCAVHIGLYGRFIRTMCLPFLGVIALLCFGAFEKRWNQ